MNKNIFGAVGLSGLLLLGSAPAVVLAHEGHDHGDRRSGYSEQEESERYEPRREDDRGRYRREREESGRYDPRRNDDQWEDTDDEDEEDEAHRPSSRRYPRPEREQSSPRERQGRPR